MHCVAKLLQIVQLTFCFEIGAVLFGHECIVRPGVINRAGQGVQIQLESIDLQLQSPQDAVDPLVDVGIQVRLHCGHSYEFRISRAQTRIQLGQVGLGGGKIRHQL